jgi:tetratricopeptide (TPR) repeat protein
LIGLIGLTTACFGLGERYALVIGITGYPHFPECERLRFADDDARLFTSFIISEEGGRFPLGNVRVLENHTATREAIKDEITWLSRRVERDDIVYIFFSGHGVVDDLGLAYFMPYDGDPHKADYRGFRADHFVEELRLKINSKYMVLFVDACHSGSVLSEGLAKEGPANITRSLKQAWEDAYKGQDAMSMAFLSAGCNQRSYEDPALGHGLFTYYLVKGMKGSADETGIADGDGLVTAGELYRYLLDRVEYHARHQLAGREQSPTKSPEFTPSFPFAVNSETCRKMISTAVEARAHYNNARTLADCQGDIDGAITQYRTAIGLDPVYADAHAHLGYLLQQKGDLDGAIAEYRTAIEIDPNHSTSRYNLAVAFQHQGDLNRATAEYRRVIRIDPANADAHAGLGIALYDMKDFTGAIAACRAALRTDPSSCMIHNNLGLALKSIGELDSAAAEYRAAISLHPDYASAHSNLGSVLYKQGNIDGALRAFQAAISSDPGFGIAHYNLGRVHERQGDLLAAAAEFDLYAGLTSDAARAESARRRAEKLRQIAEKMGQTRQ